MTTDGPQTPDAVLREVMNAARQLVTLAEAFARLPYFPASYNRRTLAHADALKDGTEIYAMVKRRGTNTERRGVSEIVAGFTIDDDNRTEVRLTCVGGVPFSDAGELSNPDVATVRDVFSRYYEENFFPQ